MRNAFAVLIAGILFAPGLSLAQSAPDLGIYAGDIRFSTETLTSGTNVRVYGTIHNEGDVDTGAYVFFYQGEIPLGASQVVTVSAQGNPDDVWVDFTVPYGSFNIRAEIRGQDPGDVNSGNDLAITTLFAPIVDDDGDGVEDSEDNCPEDANPDQADADNDGMGDVCDPDDDNDGVSDDVEMEQGTDSTDPDTDNDGVQDANDFAPTDPDVQSQPVQQESDEESGIDDQASSDSESDDEERQDEQSDQEGELEEELEERELEHRDSYAIFQTSPRAAFVYQPLAWKTYLFRSLYPEGEDVQFHWDFGDGSTSVQREAEHAYRTPGAYIVTLTVTNADGEVEGDAAEIHVSFFHIQNPIIQLLLGALALLLLASLILAFWKKRGQDEGEEKPVQQKKKQRRTIKRKK